MEITAREVIRYFETTIDLHAHEPRYSMWINLWRLLIKIESPSLESIHALQEQYASFLAPVPGEPDVVINFVRADDFLSFPPKADYFKYTEFDESLLVAPFFVTRFSDNGNYIEMVVEDGYDTFLLSAMRAIAPYLAIKQGGTLIHASAICYDGRLYAFMGQSGAGKSTVIRMLSEIESSAQVLTDEAVMVEVDLDNPDRLVGWGTPYGREHGGANLCVPLGYCFFLVQDTTTYLELLRPGQAAARSMSNLWCINTLGGLATNALEIAVQISEQIPCYDLHFELNHRFWEQIRHLTVPSGKL